MFLHTETRLYRLETQFSGLCARLTRKQDGASVFFQGDDAAAVIDEADAASALYDSAEDSAFAFDREMSTYNDIMR